MKELFLALGILLSVSSQLRPGGLVVGPGELCLVVGLALIVMLDLPRMRGRFAMPFEKVIWFWLVFALSLWLGSMAAAYIGDRHDAGLVRHDIMAYVLMAGMSVLLAMEPERAVRVGWLMMCIGCLWLGLQLLHGFGVFSIGGVDPWFWHRFRGWSLNPNQLALASAVLGVVSIYFIENVAGTFARMIALTCLLLSLTTGLMTASDGFLLVAAAAAVVFACLKVRSLWETVWSRHSLVRSASLVTILALPIFALTAAPYATSFASSMQVQAGTDANNRAVERMEADVSLRVETWKAAIRRGFESYLLGLGPGPHLAMPTSIEVRLRDAGMLDGGDTAPGISEIPNFEAHNTVLDLFTQGGLLAVLAISWIFASAMRGTLGNRHHALTTLLCSLAVFSLFHLIIRQPLFWFSIVFCLSTSQLALEARKRHQES